MFLFCFFSFCVSSSSQQSVTIFRNLWFWQIWRFWEKFLYVYIFYNAVFSQDGFDLKFESRLKQKFKDSKIKMKTRIITILKRKRAMSWCCQCNWILYVLIWVLKKYLWESRNQKCGYRSSEIKTSSFQRKISMWPLNQFALHYQL